MKKYDSDDSGFLDLLFNCCFLFVVLFILSTRFLNPIEVSNKNIQLKAEAIITVSWDKEINDDVDVYLEDPSGGVAWFGNKNCNFSSIDRDDLGWDSDSVETEYGIFTYDENTEVVTIRKWLDGEYVLWVHNYTDINVEELNEVSVVMEVLNPVVSIVQKKTALMTREGQDHTVFRFIVKDEKIVEFNYLKKDFPPIGKRREPR